MNVSIPCVCPPLSNGGPRHQEDVVTLRDRLGFRGGLTVRNAIVVAKGNDDKVSVAEILTAMTEVYLLEGIESWSIVDQRNKAVPADKAGIRAFMDEHPDEAMTVADAADALYMNAVITPLVQKASASSRPTPIDASTSATTGSAHAQQKRSKRSSISTTQTDGITAMYSSPGGDSRSSQS